MRLMGSLFIAFYHRERADYTWPKENPCLYSIACHFTFYMWICINTEEGWSCGGCTGLGLRRSGALSDIATAVHLNSLCPNILCVNGMLLLP